VDVETAIRTRRTHKSYGSEPVPRQTLLELLDLARFAPNHHVTQPWRFRVLGPQTLDRLKAAADEKERPKLDRAPTLVVASAVLGGDPLQDEEDLQATAVAVYVVLLAAHARGLGGYWRTPAVLRTAEGQAAVGLPEDERFVSLVHLGTPQSVPPEKVRSGAESYVAFLD
jgi:nitroreductase